MRLERNSAGIPRAHIVKQEVRVRTERDVAQRRNYGGGATSRCSELYVLLRREALHVADVAPNALEYSLTRGGLRCGRLRRYLGQQSLEMRHLYDFKLLYILRSVLFLLKSGRKSPYPRDMFVGGVNA